MITFNVVGVPMPKGSLRGFVPGWRKGMVTKPQITLTSTTKGLPQWTNTVRATARIANIPLIMEGPVSVGLVFRLPAPDYIRKRRDGKRPPHTTPPDLDKLIRAVLDAITGVGWHDDKQVDSVKATKRYALPLEEPGVKVYITPSRAEELTP